MIGFILAGALLALIVYLLFRRLRQLSWQLTQLRVERDCDEILHKIGIRAGSRPVVTERPGAPARTKGHLALYMGGGAAAALVGLNDAWRRHRPAIVASGTAAAAAIVVGVASLILAPSAGPPGGPGPAPPPTGAVSPAPSEPGGKSSRGAAPPTQSPPAGSGSSGVFEDDVGTSVSTSGLTALQVPPGVDAVRGTGTPPQGSPGDGSPPASVASPSPSAEPSAPEPAASASGDVAMACLKLRAVVDLALCLGA